jgi:hypothetical protein
MGVDWYVCSICKKVRADTDPDCEHCHNDTCGAFICGACVRTGHVVKFCARCPAGCPCNERLRQPEARRDDAKCDHCACAHLCAYRYVDCFVLCPTCADPPAPRHSAEAVLEWILANCTIQPGAYQGLTRAQVEERMGPPPPGPPRWVHPAALCDRK